MTKAQTRARKKIYQRDWYYKNKARHIAMVRRSERSRVAKIRRVVNDLKSRPCKDCHKRFDPICMDFDHLPGHKKIKSISEAVCLGWGLPRLQAELKKCDLVCSNCHRLRTRRRWRNKLTF